MTLVLGGTGLGSPGGDGQCVGRLPAGQARAGPARGRRTGGRCAPSGGGVAQRGTRAARRCQRGLLPAARAGPRQESLAPGTRRVGAGTTARRQGSRVPAPAGRAVGSATGSLRGRGGHRRSSGTDRPVPDARARGRPVSRRAGRQRPRRRALAGFRSWHELPALAAARVIGAGVLRRLGRGHRRGGERTARSGGQPPRRSAATGARRRVVRRECAFPRALGPGRRRLPDRRPARPSSAGRRAAPAALSAQHPARRWAARADLSRRAG